MFCIQIAFVIRVGVTVGYSSGEIAGVVVLSILPGVGIISMSIILCYLGYFRKYWKMSTYEYITKMEQEAGAAILEAESIRVESHRMTIDEEQEEIRAEWKRNREKQLAEKKKSSEPAPASPPGAKTDDIVMLAQV